MKSKKILMVDFRNHRDTSSFKQTIDDIALETCNPDHIDTGVRIRKYAITPGRILQTLERVREEIDTTSTPGVAR